MTDDALKMPTPITDGAQRAHEEYFRNVADIFKERIPDSLDEVFDKIGKQPTNGWELARQFEQRIATLESQLAEARKAFPFPEITAGNADAIAFHLEQQRETLLTPVATAIWLREVAKSIRALDQAITPPNRKEN